jgi:hypothetical protein
VIRKIIILLIIGHALTAVPILLQYTALKEVKVQPLLSGPWKWDASGVYLLWWLQYVADDLLWIIYSFCLVLVSWNRSDKLFIIGCNWLFYHIVDHAMLWYNYKNSNWLSWVLLACTSITIIAACWKTKMKVVK